MDRLLKISESEWQVMKILWNKKICTANEIIKTLSKSTDWRPNTVRTLINRLVKKGAIGFKVNKVDNKTYNYFPNLLEYECISAESKSFLKRVFDGSLSVMLANFISESDLSSDEIDELKRILDKKKS